MHAGLCGLLSLMRTRILLMLCKKQRSTDDMSFCLCCLALDCQPKYSFSQSYLENKYNSLLHSIVSAYINHLSVPNEKCIDGLNEGFLEKLPF